MRNLIIFIGILLLITGCGIDVKTADQEPDINDIFKDPYRYDGMTVEFNGTAFPVCGAVSASKYCSLALKAEGGNLYIYLNGTQAVCRAPFSRSEFDETEHFFCTTDIEMNKEYTFKGTIEAYDYKITYNKIQFPDKEDEEKIGANLHVTEYHRI